MPCCATGCRRADLQLDSRPFFEHYPMDGTYDPKTGQLHLQHLRARYVEALAVAGAACMPRLKTGPARVRRARFRRGSVPRRETLAAVAGWSAIFTVPPAASLPNSSSSASGRLICSWITPRHRPRAHLRVVALLGEPARARHRRAAMLHALLLELRLDLDAAACRPRAR
mgnify:CR=1 FL=1